MGKETNDKKINIWLDKDGKKSDKEKKEKESVDSIKKITSFLKEYDENSYNLLVELSVEEMSKKELEKIINIISGFKATYRYNYNVIYVFIYTLVNSEKYRGNVDCLTVNIINLEKMLKEKNINDKKYAKFVQYVQMETSRAARHKQDIDEIRGFITKYENYNIDFSDLKQKNKSLEKEIEKSNKSIKKQQSNYISILGIFSAVVLGFTGALSFTTSILDNINEVGIYRLLLVIIMLGFILVNGIYALLEYIERINSGKTDNDHYKRVIDSMRNYIVHSYDSNNEKEFLTENEYIMQQYIERKKKKKIKERIINFIRIIVNKIEGFFRLIQRKTIAKLNLTFLIALILVIWAYNEDYFSEEEKLNKNIAKYEQLKEDLAEYDLLIDTDEDGNLKLKEKQDNMEKLKETEKPKSKSKSKEDKKSSD